MKEDDLQTYISVMLAAYRYDPLEDHPDDVKSELCQRIRAWRKKTGGSVPTVHEVEAAIDQNSSYLAYREKSVEHNLDWVDTKIGKISDQ